MVFIRDDEFIRGKCPMTKEEIRILSIVKMNLEEDSSVLDIGSGTGSITVQSACIAQKGKVLAIEKEEEAFNITNKNIEKFNCRNVKVIKNNANTVLDMLISENIRFNSVFIGGSNGELEEIILKANTLLYKDGIVVMNFITLENTYRAIEVMKKLEYKVDISLINISKNRENTSMMMAHNPIYIIQCIKS